MRLTFKILKINLIKRDVGVYHRIDFIIYKGQVFYVKICSMIKF
jgi:hypothetical protein